MFVVTCKECVHARLSGSVPLSRIGSDQIIELVGRDEYKEDEVMLTTLALNVEEWMERPIVVHGEEARIGRPEVGSVVDWLKERIA